VLLFFVKECVVWLVKQLCSLGQAVVVYGKKIALKSLLVWGFMVEISV
jgi:hypothetical protein